MKKFANAQPEANVHFKTLFFSTQKAVITVCVCGGGGGGGGGGRRVWVLISTAYWDLFFNSVTQESVEIPSRKHAYIILTPLNPTFM